MWGYFNNTEQNEFENINGCHGDVIVRKAFVFN